MKHLKPYNESEVTFKNSDDDIRMFFTDYTDEDRNALTIKNALIYDGNVVDETTYMKDTSKYRRCKVITVRVGKPNGIHLFEGKCMTDFNVLSDIISDIQRFYELSGEEVNYMINTSYMGMEVKFVVLGDMIKPEESQSAKIDGYLERISECIKKKGHKRITIKGNWLDMKFSKRDDYSYVISDKLSRIGDGRIIESPDRIDTELISIRNEAWEDGLKFYLTGGDQQVVLKLVKRN